ncbi:phosphotransferase family protein [Paenibacillus sp. GCM10012306]|uniref:phosphotransferase family protein n=1 Tax=Paenibacillus sp. GCM10012306 TaxID=3317342 RepID=UPI00361B8D57
MESVIKAKLNDEQLNLLVKSAFGAATVIMRQTELTAGMFNTGYDLELNDGRSVILKVAPAAEVETLSCEKDIMRTEVEALRLIRATGLVPVPEVFSYDLSLKLIPYPYFFMEKIEGQPYNEIKEGLTPQEREAIESQIGRYNRCINEVTGEHFGYFHQEKSSLTATWRATFEMMMDNLLQDSERLGVQLPVSYAEIRERINTQLPTLDEVTQPRLVHWDLWNGNVFVKDGSITAIIDWERALWGDELMEYYFRRQEGSPAFYQGYGMTTDSPNQRIRKKLYDLYFDLIMVIECYSRKYENQGHVEWTHHNFVQGWGLFCGEEEAGSVV